MAGPELKYSDTKGTARPDKGVAASSNQVYQMIMQEAQRRGLSWFKSHHAMGMIGSFVQETGNFRKDVIDFDIKGDSGTAHGLMQWRGARYNNLLDYAKKTNADARDLRVQISFAFEEGSSKSPYSDGGSIRAFNEMSRAQDIAGATIAFIHAERPAGYTSKNPAGAHDAQKRIAHANKAAGVADAEGFRSSEGEYSFTSDGTYDNMQNNYDVNQQLGYSPEMKKGRGIGDYSDFMPKGETNTDYDAVNEFVDTSRLFADSVTGFQGGKDFTKNIFGVQ